MSDTGDPNFYEITSYSKIEQSAVEKGNAVLSTIPENKPVIVFTDDMRDFSDKMAVTAQNYYPEAHILTLNGSYTLADVTRMSFIPIDRDVLETTIYTISKLIDSGKTLLWIADENMDEINRFVETHKRLDGGDILSAVISCTNLDSTEFLSKVLYKVASSSNTGAKKHAKILGVTPESLDFPKLSPRKQVEVFTNVRNEYIRKSKSDAEA